MMGPILDHMGRDHVARKEHISIMATHKPKLTSFADYFRATGSELKLAAEAGDDAATAEIARRAAKKAAKATPATA